jgi:hypothetical protein
MGTVSLSVTPGNRPLDRPTADLLYLSAPALETYLHIAILNYHWDFSPPGQADDLIDPVLIPGQVDLFEIYSPLLQKFHCVGAIGAVTVDELDVEDGMEPVGAEDCDIELVVETETAWIDV